MSIRIVPLFDRQKLDKSQDYEGYLMISVTAPQAEGARAPVQLVLVIDTSGSMEWIRGGDKSKIDYTKETACKIVENLTAEDYLAIVTFNAEAHLEMPLRKVDNKEAIYGIINRIRTGGNTNLSEGIQMGTSVINDQFQGVKRLLVLTDGRPTSGIQDTTALNQFLTDRDSSSGVSFFGFGTDADPELLLAMSRTAQGNYYYIDRPETVRTSFARELGGLISCVAQNIKLTFKPNLGHQVLQVLNDFTTRDVEGGTQISAEDIYSGEKKNILLKMKISKPEGRVKNRPYSLGHLTTSYDITSESRTVEEAFNVKVNFVKADEADAQPLMEVREQVALMEAARAQVEAVRFANQGNFVAAQSVLRATRGILADAAANGSEAVMSYQASYDQEAMSFCAATYSADTGNQVLSAATGYRRQRGTGGGLSERLTNQSMGSMIQSFNGPATPPAPTTTPPTPPVTPPDTTSNPNGGTV